MRVLIWYELMLVLVVMETAWVRAGVESELEFGDDPRRNLSAYDLVISHPGEIGDVRSILIRRGLIDPSINVFKYKLIFYSPELIPPELIYQPVPTTTAMTSDGPALNDTGAAANRTNEFYDESENIFSVQLTNGSIHLKTPEGEPALEYLCMKRKYCLCYSCVFMLNVIYATENKINSEAIRIFIDDHNDFAPQFQNSSAILSLNVSEASHIGDQFVLENATAFDADAFYNRVAYYLSDKNDESNEDDQLMHRTSFFDVLPSNQSSTSLVFILKAHLDYEKRQAMDFYLVAHDNGYPNTLKSWIRVHVNIIDENDNAPVCESSLFIANLRENQFDKNFIQIRANDLDSDQNGHLEYTLEMTNSDQLTSGQSQQQHFTIDNRTGWLSINQPLDFESKTWHELTIRVQDTPVDPAKAFRTFCRARVNVIDMNDNPAQMKVIKYLNESIQSEFYAMNTHMAELDITKTTKSDRPYNFNYVVSNRFDEAVSDMKNQVEVFENNKQDLVLAMFRVFDRDSLSNYRFAIQSALNSQDDASDSMFEVRESDRQNREFELVAKSRFDAEKLQAYRLRIILYDLDDEDDHEVTNSLMVNTFSKTALEFGKTNFKVNLFMKVKVLDLNDNRPQFTKHKYEFAVKENEAGLLNLNLNNLIESNDLDVSEPNSRLDYRIVDKNNLTTEASRHFKLDYNLTNYNYPGLLLTTAFDYETDGVWFEFFLVAFDKDGLSDTALVLVKIEDVNDNAPVFINANTTFVIKENMPANSFIGQIIAVDKDSPGPNSDIAFHLLSIDSVNYTNATDSTVNPMFRIYRSGVITNKIEFDTERQSLYTIRIEARDLGEPAALSNIGTFFIRIEDENDNKPYFVFPSERTRYLCLKIPVNSTTIFEVKAHDLDTNENGKLSYFLEDSDNFLTIDRHAGTVSLNSSTLADLNLTSSNFTSLRRVLAVALLVKDGGSPSLSARLNFTFYLNYDSFEMPEDVVRMMQYDLTDHEETLVVSDLVSSSEMVKLHNMTKPRSLFHVISSSVHIVILLIVLAFTIFMAFFILAMIYKRRGASKKDGEEPKGKGRKVNYEENDMKSRIELPSVSVSVSKSQAVDMSFFKDSSMSTTSSNDETTSEDMLDGCVGQMKTCLKSKIFSEAVKSPESLTVKDESSKMGEGLLRNSFRVTIKPSDTVTDFQNSEKSDQSSDKALNIYNDLSKNCNESSTNYNLSAKNLSLFVNNNTDTSQNSSTSMSNNDEATDNHETAPVPNNRFNLPTFEDFVSSSNMFESTSFPFFTENAEKRLSAPAENLEPTVLTALYKESNEQLNFDYNTDFNKYFENFYYDAGTSKASQDELKETNVYPMSGPFDFSKPFAPDIAQDPVNPLKENRLSVFNELPNSSEVLQNLLNKFESFYNHSSSGTKTPNATAADLTTTDGTNNTEQVRSSDQGDDTTEESTLASLAKFSSSGASQTNFAQC